MDFDDRARVDPPRTIEASFGLEDSFPRRVALVTRDILETIDAVRAEMMSLERPVFSSIFDRPGRPLIQIELSCDTVDGQCEFRLVRGVRILRGAEMIAAEERTAAEYAQSDREDLGLLPEATNEDFLRAITRLIQEDPLQGSFFLRGVSGGGAEHVPYSEFARIGRFSDRCGEYRVEKLEESSEVDVIQIFDEKGSLNTPMIFSELTPAKRYCLETASNELKFNHPREDGNLWGEFEPFSPNPEEAWRILGDLNDLDGALRAALADLRSR
jgi:hypothetical protein